MLSTLTHLMLHISHFMCVARQQEGVQQFLASSNTGQRDTSQHMLSVSGEKGRKGGNSIVKGERIGRNRGRNFGFLEQNGVDILISALALSISREVIY